MLHVDESGETTGLLSLGDDSESERRFTRGFRAVNLNDTAAGKAASAQGLVNEQISGGDDTDVRLQAFATHAEDGPFAVVFLNLLNGEIEIAPACFGELVGFWGRFGVFFGCAGHDCGCMCGY